MNGQTRVYGYDFMSRMTSLTDTNGSVFSYAFDGEGNRTRQSLNDCLVTRFVYDGPNVVLELNASNQVVRAYVNGPGLDQPIERIDFINGTARNRQVFHTDGLGSVSVLTDENGATIQSYAYEAFGQIRAQTGTDLNRVTYTAREALGDSLGFYYYRNRVLDPATGRFISEDPLGFVDGANRYVYCINNLIRFIDPFGFQWWIGPVMASGGVTNACVSAANNGKGAVLSSIAIGGGGLAGGLATGTMKGMGRAVGNFVLGKVQNCALSSTLPTNQVNPLPPNYPQLFLVP